VFQLARRIVTDARHQTYLMIDEDKRRILRSHGLVGADLIGHGILLRLLLVAVRYANKLTIAEQQSDH
jgi:hypothetical protein